MRTPGGVWAGPITPMNADLTIDFSGLRSLTEFLIDGGVDGLIPAAFTAEVESLDIGEHKRLLETVVESAGGRVPIYGGVSRPSIVETREMVAYAPEVGLDGIFVIPPFCNAYTLPEMVAFVKDVAGRSSLPVMLYNCPNYTKVNFPPEVQSALAEIENIASSKEGNQEQLHGTVLAAGDGMAVFTARDSHLVASLAVGADGVTSFVANIAPRLIVDLFAAATAGDTAVVHELHARVSMLVDALVKRSYPLLLKEAMTILGLPSGPARRIEGGATQAERAELTAALRQALPVEAT